jgi:hypothetical protein
MMGTREAAQPASRKRVERVVRRVREPHYVRDLLGNSGTVIRCDVWRFLGKGSIQ